jgi:hypothetical protein
MKCQDLNVQDFAGCAAAIAVIQPLLANWRFRPGRVIQNGDA